MFQNFWRFKRKIYDVAVVGAGPVGLIFANKMAKKYQTVLIDAQKIPHRNKSYVIPRKWAQEADYQKYAVSLIKKIGIASLQGKHSIRQLVPEYYCLNLNEKRLMQDEINSLKQAGGLILPETKIEDFQPYHNQVQLISKKRKITARLVLDCSGIDSIFINKQQNLKHRFYWNAYGLKFHQYDTEASLSYLFAQVGNYDGYKILIDDVPDLNGRYTIWMYILSPKRYSLETLKELYKKVLKSDFLKPRVKNYKPIQEKYGWIPAFDFESRATNNILSLGDAGGLSPFQNGMTFSFNLHKADDFATNLSLCLDQNNLDESSLNQTTKLSDLEELNFDFGKIIFMFGMNTNSTEFDKIVNVFDELSLKDLTSTLFFMDLNLLGIIRVFQAILKHFSVPEFLNILGRDGFIDEVKIGQELFQDFIQNLMHRTG